MKTNSIEINEKEKELAQKIINALFGVQYNTFYDKTESEDFQKLLSFTKKLERNIKKDKYSNLNITELARLLENLDRKAKPDKILDILAEIYHRERKSENYYLTNNITLNKDLFVEGLYNTNNKNMLATINLAYHGKIKNAGYKYFSTLMHELEHERQYAILLRLFKNAKITKRDKVKTMLYLNQKYYYNSINNFLKTNYPNIEDISNSKLSILLKEVDYFDMYSEFEAELKSIKSIQKVMSEGVFANDDSAFKLLLACNYRISGCEFDKSSTKYCSEKSKRKFLKEIDSSDKKNPVDRMLKKCRTSIYKTKLLFSIAQNTLFDDVTEKDIEDFLQYVKSQYQELQQIKRYAKTFFNICDYENDINNIK